MATGALILALVSLGLLLLSVWKVREMNASGDEMMFSGIAGTSFGPIEILGIPWLAASIGVMVFAIRVKKGTCGHSRVLRSGDTPNLARKP